MISVVIPTYGGSERLDRNLPSVVRALHGGDRDWEILVVEDGGEPLPPQPQGVRVLRLPRNRGYGPAVNAGATQARGELLLVLNDDVRLHEDALVILERHLESDVMATVPAIRSPLAACGDEGGKRGRVQAGLIEIMEAPSKSIQPTLYPVGCCFLCRRDIFQSFGGYDERYAPFFWEDVDLGYRAWRSGLRSLHVPAAVCWHEGSATLAQEYEMAERARMFDRNRILFHLLNTQAPLRQSCLGALLARALFEDAASSRTALSEALDVFSAAPRTPQPGSSDATILQRASAC
jgi:GT2 family glycosyltransferase